MADSRLNAAEWAVQHWFMDWRRAQALTVGGLVVLVFLGLRLLPSIPQRPPASVLLHYKAVTLPIEPGSPFRVAGAWRMTAPDPRLANLSGLATDGTRMIAVSDAGAIVRFDLPGPAQPRAWLSDISVGPGPFGFKVSRDAESIVRDPADRGWWIGFEQVHSAWLYPDRFDRAAASVVLRGVDWKDNRGAEGLTAKGGDLLAFGENGRDIVDISRGTQRVLRLAGGGWSIAEAAGAPDGSLWVLVRRVRPWGIAESVAPVITDRAGWRLGKLLSLPKTRFNNYEGMAIVETGDGWRFWLVTDDGHRFFTRTLLAAFDLPRPNKKRPAQGPGA